MRTNRAALIRMRLLGAPPLEGGGGAGGAKRLFLYKIFVQLILYLNSYIPVPSLSGQNNTYYITALGPNRLRTAPPVYRTLPMPTSHQIVPPTLVLSDLKIPPRCESDPRSSGMLRSVDS